VVPILAFLFGLLVTFLVSLFINKDEVETTTDESNVEAVSTNPAPNPPSRIINQEGDGNEVETTQESDNDEEGEMSDVSDGTDMSHRLGQTTEQDKTSGKGKNANTGHGETLPIEEYGEVKPDTVN